jgi:hypothetical protein
MANRYAFPGNATRERIGIKGNVMRAVFKASRLNSKTLAALTLGFIFSLFGTASADTPDITFTSAKVAISHDTDAGSGSPDDTNCGKIQGGPCDQFSLTAAFTVNNGSDLLADLSTAGNTIVLWFGHNSLCTAGQPEAVFHYLLIGTNGQAHTSKTKQMYKFVGKTNAVNDSNSGAAIPAVDLSINVSINTKKNSGTIKAKGTGHFGALSSALDGTIGFALVTDEASGDGGDLVTGPGDLNCTDSVTAKYRELDSD